MANSLNVRHPSKAARMAGLAFVVVGSGFGGLSMALRLRALGADVTIVERLSSVRGVLGDRPRRIGRPGAYNACTMLRRRKLSNVV